MTRGTRGRSITWDIVGAAILARNGRELPGPEFRTVLNAFLQHPPNGVRSHMEVLQASGALPETLSNSQFQQLRHRLVSAGYIVQNADSSDGRVKISEITPSGLHLLAILSASLVNWTYFG